MQKNYNNGLTVKIKKKFKRDLSFRFNPANGNLVGNYFRIKRACPLCIKYKSCLNCPFKIFETKGKKGCVEWIKKIIGKNNLLLAYTALEWSLDYSFKTQKQLKELRKKAKELIEWI